MRRLQPSTEPGVCARVYNCVAVTPVAGLARCCCPADVVVSVSRKTDASLWPALFSAVGSPSAVLELLLDTNSLTSAACFLIVVDR